MSRKFTVVVNNEARTAMVHFPPVVRNDAGEVLIDVEGLAENSIWVPEESVAAFMPDDDAISNAPIVGRVQWVKEHALYLIQLQKDYKEKVLDVKGAKMLSQKKLFEDFTGKICERFSTIYTSQQVLNKWKTMVRAYEKTEKHNSQTGRDRVECEFEQELQELLAKEPTIRPVLLMGPGQVEGRDKSNTLSSDSESEVGDTPRTSACNTPPLITLTDTPVTSRKRRATDKRLSGAEVVQDKMDELRAQLRENEEGRAKRHKEKMDMMERLLSVMERPVDH